MWFIRGRNYIVGYLKGGIHFFPAICFFSPEHTHLSAGGKKQLAEKEMYERWEKNVWNVSFFFILFYFIWWHVCTLHSIFSWGTLSYWLSLTRDRMVGSMRYEMCNNQWNNSFMHIWWLLQEMPYCFLNKVCQTYVF